MTPIAPSWPVKSSHFTSNACHLKPSHTPPFIYRIPPTVRR